MQNDTLFPIEYSTYENFKPVADYFAAIVNMTPDEDYFAVDVKKADLEKVDNIYEMANASYSKMDNTVEGNEGVGKGYRGGTSNSTGGP